VTPNQVLPSVRLVDEWISYPSGENGLRLSDRLRLLWRLRKARYDTLIYLGPRIRSARDVRRDIWFFRLAGVRTVIGDRNWTSLPPRQNGNLPVVEHEADHLLERLASGGISTASPGNAEFALDLTPTEIDSAQTWLRRNVPSGLLDRIVGFGPGSKWPSKIWPEERFAALGRELVGELDVFPVVFGGPEDREVSLRLLAAWGTGASAAGTLSVREAAAALRNCRLYVGNDTGTMHLAAAVGTPCVAIMAALDWPGHWSPYGKRHTVLRTQVPCAGCLLRECTVEDMRCLKEISVAEVAKACLEKFENPTNVERENASANV
jgi:heptosyltransferase III